MMYSEYIYAWHICHVRYVADMLKGRSQTQNGHGKWEKWSGKEWDALQLGWPHLGRKKNSTTTVEGEEREVAVFRNKIWGWGNYSDTKTECEPVMLYCCKTGNILGCRRSIVVWKIPGGILLLLLKKDLSCSVLPSLGQYPSRRRWKSCGKKSWERAAGEVKIWKRKCESTTKLLVLSLAEKRLRGCMFVLLVVSHQRCWQTGKKKSVLSLYRYQIKKRP